MKTRLELDCPSCDGQCVIRFTAPDHVAEFQLFCPFCGDEIGLVVDEEREDGEP